MNKYCVNNKPNCLIFYNTCNNQLIQLCKCNLKQRIFFVHFLSRWILNKEFITQYIHTSFSILLCVCACVFLVWQQFSKRQTWFSPFIWFFYYSIFLSPNSIQFNFHSNRKKLFGIVYCVCAHKLCVCVVHVCNHCFIVIFSVKWFCLCVLYCMNLTNYPVRERKRKKEGLKFDHIYFLYHKKREPKQTKNKQ